MTNVPHNMPHPAHRSFGALGFAAIILAAAACGGSTSTAPKPVHPVAFQVAAHANAATPTGSTGPLQITSFRVVVGTASLGGGGQFGCVDCQDSGVDGATEGQQSPPQLLNVPISGGAVLLATEPVKAGRYGQAEISVEAPGATLKGISGWPAGTSMEIVGRINGKPFTLLLATTGKFRETLTPPVDVAAGTATAIPVTITLPVASWFSSNGTTLDPSVPAQRSQIEANARASLQALDGKGETASSER